jgi:hypothetical protein
MTEPTPPSKPARKTRHKKPRQVWFKATVRNDHVHLHASAPTKWFQILRWIIVVILIALTMHFLPELWQSIQAALQTVPK